MEGGGDGDAGDDYGPPVVDDYRDYSSPKEEPKDVVDVNGYCDYGSPKAGAEPQFVDVYYHPFKEEPEPQLRAGYGDAIDANGYCDYGPPKEEPEPEFSAMDGGSGNAGDNHAPNISADTDDCYDDYGSTEEEPKLVLPPTSDDVDTNCSHCGITLSTREFKIEHELRCTLLMKRKELESQITEVYHCGYCRCPFLNEEYKEQHQQRWCPKRPVAKRKPSNDSYFECAKCEYVTKWKNHLDRHVLKHNKINAEWFACTQCSYKTVYKNDMTEHMKIHGNTFSCCCPICGKSFRKKTCLDDHLVRQHSDESDEVSKLISRKVYTCNICDRFRTTVKTAFNRHLSVTHLKGVGCQKYECPRCPYSSFSKAHLTMHSKRHAGQKDYQCAVCKKQFIRKPGLDSHILYIHADNVDLVKTITSKIHRCELCSFKTVDITRLKSHERSKKHV